MFNVNIDSRRFDENEAQEWVNELANVYADMEVSDQMFQETKSVLKLAFQGWMIRR